MHQSGLWERLAFRFVTPGVQSVKGGKNYAGSSDPGSVSLFAPSLHSPNGKPLATTLRDNNYPQKSCRKFFANAGERGQSWVRFSDMILIRRSNVSRSRPTTKSRCNERGAVKASHPTVLVPTW